MDVLQLVKRKCTKMGNSKTIRQIKQNGVVVGTVYTSQSTKK